MDQNFRLEMPEQKKFIWQHNLEMMDGEMQKLLNSESIGGNAGRSVVDGKKYSCAAANGYANPETGEILAFGNPQDLSKDIIASGKEFTMRVAFDLGHGFFKVLEILATDQFSPKGQAALDEAAAKYNIKHAFEEVA